MSRTNTITCDRCGFTESVRPDAQASVFSVTVMLAANGNPSYQDKDLCTECWRLLTTAVADGLKPIQSPAPGTASYFGGTVQRIVGAAGDDLGDGFEHLPLNRFLADR